MRESEMDILLDAMRALVDERHGVQHEVLDSGEEITYVMYRSPHGDEIIGTVTYDWAGDGLWEASSLREDMGSYETHDEAVAEVVWYAPHASSSWDRYILVGDALIRTWMSAPDVQDVVRLAFPGRDLPVREVTPQEAHRLLALAGRL